MKGFLKKVVKLATEKKQPKDLAQFVEEFYSQNHARDFQNYNEAEMTLYARQSFDFLQQRGESENKIQITNIESSFANHSIIDIVTSDSPFLVDSVVALIKESGFDILNIMHPIFYVKRSASGKISEFKAYSDEDPKESVESVIQVHLKDLITDEEAKLLEKKIEETLLNIAIVVDDWQKIVDQLKKSQEQFTSLKEPSKDVQEVGDFINWLIKKGFIFLGFIEIDYKKDKSGKYYVCENKNNPPLGVFRSKHKAFRPNIVTNSNHEEISYAIKNPYTIEILKSSYKSRIHRFVNSERIRIQKFSSKGEVVGEYRIIGLFTSTAYYQSPTSIPFIKGKIETVIKKSGYSKRSHNYKDLLSVLKHYPRDELFQIDVEDLLRISTAIVMICGRNQIKVFARKDKFNRFINCLVFMPKEQSNAILRGKIKEHLAAFYNGSVSDLYIEITESSLIRFQVIIKIDEQIDDLREDILEQEIVELSKPWNYLLKEEIYKISNNKVGGDQYKNYGNAFGVSYVSRFTPAQAAHDIQLMEKCLKDQEVTFDFCIKDKLGELKIFNPKKEIHLSHTMPVLESFGLEVIHEHTYLVTLEDSSEIRVNYFRISLDKADSVNEDLKEKFQEALYKAWDKSLGLGSLNKLLLAANLDWRTISLIKSYVKYLFQTGLRSDQDFISEVMIKNIEATKEIIELFKVKFDPSLELSLNNRKEKAEVFIKSIRSKLNKISNATHDDVIRRFYHIVDATLRTNFYQKDAHGNFKDYISLKFNCKRIPGLPLPVPYAEIFVHSNSMEGVHLRGGKVARGGLRWSDRQVDFRTEVLGLVKAQMTKNAVIVPVGSKGGFVIKEDLSDLSREEFMNQGIKCYKQFLRGILDVTDNIVSNKVIHPKGVICHDEADPYLVVAADKGTATFSDIANSVSAEYNFWLGDAFASGGSVGYDHKKMGITAKGAWVCVTRHFREIGIDCQKEEFTCVGIGDMAGDVFGNGMLCSKATKLVAAFNHMHIFIDPEPNAAKSYKERERLFNLPRSSWLDYNKSLISKGGGIFERSAKSIKLTKQIKELLGVEDNELTPDKLIKAILKAKVDLLWNGGIGTYVKSTSEGHADVGDRTNDPLRVNGEELGCKIVGEGGNLGFTQLGRIEFALNGGHINTDSMDNSAGVDCSDHEVNIKIALTAAIQNKKIDIEKRNKILELMTDEVADLVLSDNFLQSQAVSNAVNHGPERSTVFANYISRLENDGFLNREVEFLPSTKEINKRKADGIGFTRPEFCVMLSYAKMEIYQELLQSDLLNDKYLEKELISYFPRKMRKDFVDEITGHSLKKEIIATQITNYVVNYTGIYFASQVAQENGYKISEVVRSIIIAVDSFGLQDIWQRISQIEAPVDHKTQSEMFHSVSKLLERAVLWLLRHEMEEDLTSIIARYQKVSEELISILPEVMAQDSKFVFDEKIKDLESKSVSSKSFVKKIASLDPLAAAFDISEIATNSVFDLKTIATIYFEVGTKFSLKWLRGQLLRIEVESHWDRISKKTITEDLYTYQMKISQNIVRDKCNKKDGCSIESVESWAESHGFSVERYYNFIKEIKLDTIQDISIFIIVLNRLKPIAT